LQFKGSSTRFVEYPAKKNASDWSSNKKKQNLLLSPSSLILLHTTKHDLFSSSTAESSLITMQIFLHIIQLTTLNDIS
jgi:hypothetical protein